MAIIASASSAALASDVTIPNTFTAGTAAVAAEVNANFTAVKTAVDDNNTNIGTNATDIATNAAAISTNTTNIGANTTAIGTNTTNIGANTTAIGTNTTNIGANTTAIGTNTTNIGTNTTDIANNATDIATNATNIATNAADIATLQQNGNSSGVTCAGNDANDIMVRVGPVCVDKYEASVWSTADGSMSGTQYGDGSDNYPGGCSDNANGCTGADTIYARSEAGVNPSTNITWFQAQQACAASGKRLITNAEWQMAVAGTPDPTVAGDNGTTECATTTAKGTTGARSGCTSNFGVNDMIGNVWEMVADWVQGSGAAESSGVEGANYGGDVIAGVNPAASQAGQSLNMPGVIWRGGRAGLTAGNETKAGAFAIAASNAPSVDDPDLGFRCAR